MKNKKMVATLASLCLIVVAVVAAVVGVLAAVNQAVNSTMSVKFTALNVNASVELKSKGPVSGAESETYAAKANASADDYSVRFYPYTPKASSTVTLQGEDYTFGWKATTEDAFYGVAIYRFEIKNYHTGHVLTVTPTIGNDADGTEIAYYYSESGTLAFTDIQEDRNPQTGDLTTNTFGIKSTSLSGYNAMTTATPFYLAKATAADTPTTMYAYMIVGLVSIASDVNASNTANLANILSFALTDGGQTTVPTV